MSKKLSLLLMTLVLAVMAAACGNKEAATTSSKEGTAPTAAASKELTIKHQLGETKVKTNPAKVVVFDMGVLDSLDKLGVEVAGVPYDGLPSYLKKYKEAKYTNVGGLKEPSFEVINKLKPDLIIISGRQQDAYKELSSIAPTIFMGVDAKRYMESFKENAKQLGQIFGKEAQVDQELAKVDEAIKGIKDKVGAGSKNGLITLVNGGKISAYGPGSRFGIIHDVFGVPAVDKTIEVSTHGQSISNEFIVEKNPDYLFVIDRDSAVGTESAGAKKVIENELVKTTKAFKEGNIIYLNPDYWYLSGGGLASVAEMVKEVSAGIK
ncbi:siderophore ABC transporter substrate-binding protein [Paenibacillus chitinolyticus]|uniref:siderophore ABC transporter substrate-binding protein n=1 Tax=Paenibacillus chitinolyticus TaxID=79263 RepID=UPI00366F1409